MKFLRVILILFFALAFFTPREIIEAGSCLAFNGKVYIENGGSAKAKLSCAGDDPVGPSNCRGTIDTGPKEYSDGQSYNLPNCSCLIDNCLKVQPPPGCTIMQGGSYCGANGDTKTGDIRIKCAPPPTTPTPTPREVCGSPYCDTNLGDCQWGYKQETIECKYYDGNNNLIEKKYKSSCAKSDLCKVPANTPTPTKTPVPDAPTPTRTPTSPPGAPTATRTPTSPPGAPTATRTPTSPPGNPTATKTPVPSSPPPTATKQPPTATPTPDFNPAMCKCDGFDVSTLIAGQPALITAFGKVEGADTTKAKIKDMTFSFAEGNDISTKRIAKSDPIPATVLPGGTDALVRYKSSWSYTLPTDLKSGVTYSIWANIQCVKASATTLDTSVTQSVAGTSTSTNGGLFGRIMDFFSRLFGGPVTQTTQDKIAASPTLNYSPTPETESSIQSESERSLQLKTFKPAQIISNKCPILKFKF